MEHYEMRCLADWIQPAALLPNTWDRPTPLAVGGELQKDEVGEIVFCEIQPPIGAPLVDEDLRKVIIAVDGHETKSYISLSGTRTSLMTPQRERVFNNKIYAFGTPHSTNPLFNTTIKYSHQVTVALQAGPNALGVTGVVQPYRVRLWGYVYKEPELAYAFEGEKGKPDGVMDFPCAINDRARDRVLRIQKDPIPINFKTWLTLPGGKDQAIPKLNPFARYAYNHTPTDGLQGDYQLRFDQGTVIDEDENMYWEFDELDALLIKSLGVTANNDTLMPPFGVFPALARTGLRIAGNYHPKGPTDRTSLFPTDGNINQLVYGRWPVALLVVAPIPPLDVYAPIPKLDRSLLIWDEIGYVVIRDDGTPAAPVPADPAGVTVALTGMRIEMRS